jgi:antitoxin HicB
MKMHTLGYPVELTENPDGGYTAHAIDIPEASTFGDTKEEALLEIEDSILSALNDYQEARRDIPAPSDAQPGQFLVYIMQP